MKFFKVLILISLTLAVSAVSAFSAEKTLKIKILFTHDLHSYLDGTKVPSGNTESVLGGYARLYTAAEKERSDKNFITILVDGGDFSMGTLYQALFTDECAELSLMAKMGYDAGTLGNHDFDFHDSGLAEALMAARAKNKKPMPLVGSNISFSKANTKESLELKKAFEKYPVKDTMLIKKNGFKIGIFGIMGKDAAFYTPYASPVFFEDPILSAAQAVAKLKKQGADIIICLSHSGTWKEKSNSEDEILAQKVPGIDFIVSGHTHTVLKSPIIIGKTAIGSSGSYGMYLGVAELEFKKGQTKLSDYRLIPIDEKIAKDPGIEKQIEYYRGLLDKKYLSFYGYSFNQKVAFSPFNFQTVDDAYDKNPWESPMGDLITDAYRYAAQKSEGQNAKPVDIAVAATGLIRGSFCQGEISVPDVFQALSLGRGSDGRPGYPLTTFYLTGAEILQVLEVGPSIALMSKEDVWAMYSGLKYTFDPAAPAFQRVSSAEIITGGGKAEPVIKDKLYKICMCSYLLKMLGLVQAVSHGVINIVPKDSSGRVLLETRILTTEPGNCELKEWIALAQYLSSFPVSDKEKLPVIPERYKNSEGRALPSKPLQAKPMGHD